MATLLQVNGLKTYFFTLEGVLKAVDGITYDIEEGETLGLVGESGCGKSPLVRTILGLYAPSEGQVVFEGRDLNSLNSREMQSYRSQVGYVQQDPYGALAPFMNVHRILEEPLVINKFGDNIFIAHKIVYRRIRYS